MNPTKVVRESVKTLTDLPNIGKRMAMDLQLLGIHEPADLLGKCAYTMYEELCRKSGYRHDPCVIDVFLAVTDFIEGGDAKPWWSYTAKRKEYLAANSLS